MSLADRQNEFWKIILLVQKWVVLQHIEETLSFYKKLSFYVACFISLSVFHRKENCGIWFSKEKLGILLASSDLKKAEAISRINNWHRRNSSNTNNCKFVNCQEKFVLGSALRHEIHSSAHHFFFLLLSHKDFLFVAVYLIKINFFQKELFIFLEKNT